MHRASPPCSPPLPSPHAIVPSVKFSSSQRSSLATPAAEPARVGWYSVSHAGGVVQARGVIPLSQTAAHSRCPCRARCTRSSVFSVGAASAPAAALAPDNAQ
eukprot:4736627-Pyramimonas_sp.AAC.1